MWRHSAGTARLVNREHPRRLVAANLGRADDLS
jgi:hypothetical protein